MSFRLVNTTFGAAIAQFGSRVISIPPRESVGSAEYPTRISPGVLVSLEKEQEKKSKFTTSPRPTAEAQVSNPKLEKEKE